MSLKTILSVSNIQNVLFGIGKKTFLGKKSRNKTPGTRETKVCTFGPFHFDQECRARYFQFLEITEGVVFVEASASLNTHFLIYLTMHASKYLSLLSILGSL